MSGYVPQPGDIVILESRESGQQWRACVESIAKSGTPKCWWLRIDGSGGQPKGAPTKARGLNAAKESLIRKAAPFEAAEFKREAGIS